MRFKYGMLAPLLTLFGVAVGFPLCYALYLSVTDYRLTDRGAPDFVGGANFAGALSNSAFWDAFATTAIYVVIAVSLELVLGFAVALALVLLMLPLIVRSTEEMLKLVPDELREASYALGVPKWKTIVSVVVPTALSGMISGIFLALARVMGETAPVLILVGYTARYNYDVFEGNMASLPLLIYNQLSNPNEAGQYRIWGAALTLIIIIGLANVLATFAAKALAPKTK